MRRTKRRRSSRRRVSSTRFLQWNLASNKIGFSNSTSPQSNQAEQTETEQGKAEPVGCTDEGAKTEVAMLLKRDR
jgi:hypothetical protein